MSVGADWLGAWRARGRAAARTQLAPYREAMKVDEPRYAIFDLDNCLAHDAWRIPLIAWHEENLDARYRAYHALGAFDAAANHFTLHTHLRASHRIIISTARPRGLERATRDWLWGRLALLPWALFMRDHGDHRPSVVLKAEHLDAVLSSGVRIDQIASAYDDRPDVVAMYAERGIPATVLSIHDACAYTPPRAAAAPFKQQEPTHMPSAPENLESALATFRQRNALYGDNYRRFGAAFLSIFPGGELPPLRTARDMDRLQLMMQLMSKLTRYAQQFASGGHRDSAHDMIVYAAMLEEMTAEGEGAAR